MSQFDGKSFQTYTSQDGLAGDQIWSITEDEEGYIWIGCHDGGISKLSGTQIVSFKEENGLVSNFVRVLHYSQNYKILLIGTEDGLSILKDDQFISFKQKHNQVIGRLQITQFIEKDDFIYVFTNGNGLYKYIPEVENLIRVSPGHYLNKPMVSSAYISNHGDTLINYQRKDLYSKSDGNQQSTELIGQVLDYTEDSYENIWIAAWNNNYMNAGGIFKYSQNGIEPFGDYLGIKSKNIFSLEFDPKEKLLWIGTEEDGLYLYPLINFSYYRPSDFNLAQLRINDTHIDALDNLWIAAEEVVVKKDQKGHISMYSLEQFQTVFSNYANKNFKEKYSYLNDPAGSYQRYQDLITAKQYHFPNPYARSNGKILPPKSLYKPLKHDVLVNKKLQEFNSVSEDNKKNIWIGTNVGVFCIDQKDRITYFDVEGNQFSNFYMDSRNNLYAASWSNLFIYPDINNEADFNLFNYYEDGSPINVSEIISKKNETWFASTDHGIFVYDGSKFYSTYHQQRPETPSFNDLCQDKNGHIIAGGNNGKIYILEFKNQSIQTLFEISEKNGLVGTSIRYLCCTNENLLIAGTNKGLNLINLEQLYDTGTTKINFINQSKGFTDYSGTTCTLKEKDELWIGSNQNLIHINLQQLLKEQFKSINLYLKSLNVNESDFNLYEIENIEPWTNVPKNIIKLPYYKNSLTFYYDAITFLDPSNIRFSYKLEGYHEAWIENTIDRKAVFQNLKPGRYRLHIKVTNTNSRSSNQELLISFIIKKPFWLKWWFITSSIIALVVLIWFIDILRTRNIKKKERLRTEIAERISEFEMKALRAQMNPHFIFNAINSIQNYMLDNDIDAALGYLSDFAKLIRLTLDNVSKKQVTLEEELNYINYYISLEQMRFDQEFETEIILPENWDGGKILIPSMILQPFVENCIKHGFVFKRENAKIRLEFQISNDNILKCIIEDNGIGRQKSRELNKNRKNHTSKGTFITNERLSLLNQTQSRKGYKVEIIDLYDEFELSIGTRVEIFVPI